MTAQEIQSKRIALEKEKRHVDAQLAAHFRAIHPLRYRARALDTALRDLLRDEQEPTLFDLSAVH